MWPSLPTKMVSTRERQGSISTAPSVGSARFQISLSYSCGVVSFAQLPFAAASRPRLRPPTAAAAAAAGRGGVGAGAAAAAEAGFRTGRRGGCVAVANGGGWIADASVGASPTGDGACAVAAAPAASTAAAAAAPSSSAPPEMAPSRSGRGRAEEHSRRLLMLMLSPPRPLGDDRMSLR